MKDAIRVMMQSRSDMFRVPGGDSVQLLKTKEHLQKLGLEVDISLDPKPNLEKYDVVHLFHILTNVHETCLKFANARRWRKPVVLSPIYWNMNEFTLIGLEGFKRKIWYSLPDGTLRRILSAIYNRDFMLIRRTLKQQMKFDISCCQERLLSECDAILPNSVAEKEILSRDFQIGKRANFFIVPNAVDRFFKDGDPRPFISRYGLENFVLCVARIEDRKNQLALIKALKGTGLRLVLVGGPNKRAIMRSYYDLCRSQADGNVLFIDWMEHVELASAYAAAKVHVLPSWYETPGLASLEAGLGGCNIATTNRGSTKEYFGDYAWYCDPTDLSSIRRAVLDAFYAEKSSTLKHHILENYTWEKAAEKTLEAYRWVLECGDTLSLD